VAETAAEQWVRQKVAVGQNADLAELTPVESGRVLSASFLAKLLATKNGLPDRPGISIEHGVVTDDLNLERLEATYDIRLNAFEFKGMVNLAGAHFHRRLAITQSIFNNGVYGFRLVVDGDLAIGGPLGQPGTNATFKANVSLPSATIGGYLFAQRADFLAPVDLSAIDVHDRALFSGSTFEDVAAFTTASFQREVDFDHVRFQRTAIFNSAKVGYLALFDDAEFAGDVDFRHMQIASDFRGDGMRFTKPAAVMFSDMKVGRLLLKNTEFSKASLEMVGLSATELDLVNIVWPPDPNRFVCDDVTYATIRVLVGKVSALEAWPAASRYSRSTYAALANYLDRRGDTKGAYNVRVARHMREAKMLGPAHELVGWFELAVSGYGEKPWYAFAWIAAFVCFGWRVFRNKFEMGLIDPKLPDPGYDPFWFSLGLFLPVVDIGLIKCWRPEPRRRFARHYAQIHVLLGWLFVPFAVASITGILR
jgi:hypothetical protein